MAVVVAVPAGGCGGGNSAGGNVTATIGGMSWRSVGTYGVDGVTVVVEYQMDVNTSYSASNGSVHIASISTSRAQGAFNCELQSSIADPQVLTVTDGAFDVPVSGH